MSNDRRRTSSADTYARRAEEVRNRLAGVGAGAGSTQEAAARWASQGYPFRAQRRGTSPTPAEMRELGGVWCSDSRTWYFRQDPGVNELRMTLYEGIVAVVEYHQKVDVGSFMWRPVINQAVSLAHPRMAWFHVRHCVRSPVVKTRWLLSLEALTPNQYAGGTREQRDQMSVIEADMERLLAGRG